MCYFAKCFVFLSKITLANNFAMFFTLLFRLKVLRAAIILKSVGSVAVKKVAILLNNSNSRFNVKQLIIGFNCILCLVINLKIVV